MCQRSLISQDTHYNSLSAVKSSYSSAPIAHLLHESRCAIEPTACFCSVGTGGCGSALEPHLATAEGNTISSEEVSHKTPPPSQAALRPYQQTSCKVCVGVYIGASFGLFGSEGVVFPTRRVWWLGAHASGFVPLGCVWPGGFLRPCHEHRWLEGFRSPSGSSGGSCPAWAAGFGLAARSAQK